MQRTIGKELDKRNGIGPGFDLLRIGLAFLIFYLHIRWIAVRTDHKIVALILTGTGDVLVRGWTRPLSLALVPMFFALSGFLVASSAFRTKSIKIFLVFRFLRIFPALATEVTLSALILGPLLTTLPLRQYFFDFGFWAYFGNILGRVRFYLPGLFESNPLPGVVNANLWTLAPEFYCYLLVTIAMMFSLFWARVLFTYTFAFATVSLIVSNSIFGTSITPAVFPGHVQIYYFFAGCLIFHWREHIPFGLCWFTVAIVLSYILLLSPRTIFIAPLPLTYVTICVGLLNLPRIPLLQQGDYSYGVYLYGFPIAQALMSLWPSFVYRERRLLLAAAIATFAFAVFSWHFIEKPFLSYKRFLAPKKQLVPLSGQASAGSPASQTL